MRVAVIGKATAQPREGKGAWSEVHFIRMQPAGIGRTLIEGWGIQSGTLRAPAMSLAAVSKAAVYDFEQEIVGGGDRAFARLVGVEYVEELPAELHALLNGGPATRSAQ